MIDLKQYLDRVISTRVQYRMLRKVMVAHEAKADNIWSQYMQDVKDMSDEELYSTLNTLSASIKARAVSLENFKVALKQSLMTFDPKMRQLMLEYATPEIYAKIRKRMNQNEFILIFSFLEIFIQEVLREIFINDPSLIGSQKKIELGRIVSAGVDKVLEEERERKIMTIDRLSIRERANYFRNELKIGWPEGLDVIFERANEIRNILVHQNPELEVTDEDLEELQRLSNLIPYALVEKAISLYPESFKG